ncbi:MAG: hypothetical protein GX786_10915 [Clostridiales bacterium]|nr:hypothetical protein [Clostridiales bacterium]
MSKGISRLPMMIKPVGKLIKPHLTDSSVYLLAKAFWALLLPLFLLWVLLSVPQNIGRVSIEEQEKQSAKAPKEIMVPYLPSFEEEGFAGKKEYTMETGKENSFFPLYP